MIGRSCRRLALAVALLAGGGPAAAGVAAGAFGQDPDWPCVQRLVPELAAAQLWSGPPPAAADWQADAEIAPLVLKLADADLPLPEAERAIAAFAAAQPAETRGGRLALLLAATLETVNGQRARLIGGIKRYARGQQALAERIAAAGAELAGLPAGPDVVPPPELAPVKEARDWDIRIFEDRQRSLTHLCDQPVRLEQRAFALARAMQGQLP